LYSNGVSRIRIPPYPSFFSNPKKTEREGNPVPAGVARKESGATELRVGAPHRLVFLRQGSTRKHSPRRHATGLGAQRRQYPRTLADGEVREDSPLTFHEYDFRTFVLVLVLVIVIEYSIIRMPSQHHTGSTPSTTSQCPPRLLRQSPRNVAVHRLYHRDLKSS